MNALEWGVLSAFFIASFSSIFTIMNPFSTVSVFIGLTEEKTKAEKINIAKKATLTAAIIMLVFGFMGNFILSFFSITLDAFRLAGGLLVARVGLGMIKGNDKARPPIARFKHHPLHPVIDEPVTFTSESTDSDGFITKEEWFLNDIKVGQGHTFTYLFDKPGTYSVLLKVTDNKGSTENVVQQITIIEEQENELPVANFEISPKNHELNTDITFRSESYDPNGFIIKEEWFINGELSKIFKGPNSIHKKKFKEPGIYNVVLRVTNNKGTRTKMFKQVIVSSDKVLEKTHTKEASDDVAIIPLAIPLLSGPGSLTTALMLMSSAQNIIMTITVAISIILVCGLSYWLLVNADRVNYFVGKTGKKIIEKLLGLIVLVVGVQFFINGITSLIIFWTSTI